MGDKTYRTQFSVLNFEFSGFNWESSFNFIWRFLSWVKIQIAIWAGGKKLASGRSIVLRPLCLSFTHGFSIPPKSDSTATNWQTQIEGAA